MKAVSMMILAAPLVVSCMMDELILSRAEEPALPETLGFTVKVSPFGRVPSRGADSWRLDDDQFGVFAFHKGGIPFLDNARVVRSSENEFICSERMNIETDGFVSFFAYSPYDDNAGWTTGSKYVVGECIDSQTDLLYAGAIDVSASSPTVDLMFRHALARICVKARSLALESGHTVKVRKVTIGGDGDGRSFYRKGTFKLSEEGTWSDIHADSSDPLTFTLDDSYFNSTASSLPEDYTDITDEDSYILVIPQDFTREGLPVEVEFSIMDGDEVIMDDRMRCRMDVDLQQGETYAICLDLTPVPISFDVVVDPWIDVEETIEFTF